MIKKTKTTLDQINDIVCQQLRLKVKDLLAKPNVYDTDLKTLGADSLDIVEIIMGIENQLGVHLSDKIYEAQNITINDLIKGVNVAQQRMSVQKQTQQYQSRTQKLLQQHDIKQR